MYKVKEKFMIIQPTSLGCFLCGKDNPIGLHMKWVEDRENKTVTAEVIIPETMRSYPGITHGGIVATLLDETAGRAALLTNEYSNLMVTLKLEVVYKQVTPTNTPLKVVGRIRKPGASKAIVEAEVVLPDGTVSAAATAIVMRPKQSLFGSHPHEEAEWTRTSPAK